MQMDQNIFQQGQKNRNFRFGLFGGSFDPIHYAHLFMAETVRVELQLDHVVFMPCFIAPHKPDQVATTGRHRLAMIRLAIKDNPHFIVSSLELEKPDISYTVETLEFVHSAYQLQRDQIFLLVGADNLQSFASWKNPQRILRLAQLVAVNRPDSPPIDAHDRQFGQTITVSMPLLDISASAIRDRVRNDLSIRYWTVPAVQDYILAHRLYKDKR